MSSQPNVRQTRSQTRAQQANANPNVGGDDRVSSHSSRNSFIPSMMDNDGGELRDCGGCNRPNNSEQYMVQCQKCSIWFHFSCANVSTTTVRTISFVCGKCMPGGDSVPQPTPSVISGISSSSSIRRARLERELQLMADEKKLMEDLSRERIDMERELRERELQEKLEREKQFIARRHALLSRQDHDEERSVRSMRSSQNSIQRTEDWVRQTGSGVVGCGDTVQQIQASTSANSGHPDEASLVNAQGVHPSSTPLRTANESPPLGDAPMANTGSEVRSIPQTVESITIEDSEDFAEGAVGLNLNKCDPSQNPSNLPLVDLQPYEESWKRCRQPVRYRKSIVLVGTATNAGVLKPESCESRTPCYITNNPKRN